MSILIGIVLFGSQFLVYQDSFDKYVGFIGGALALLTPCVFPMIPVTVSFFTKRSKTRKQGRTKLFR